MAGLIGGAMRAASGRVRDEERKRPTRPAPIVQGTQARTRDQAQMGGLIGGTYSSPKSRGFWDEIMADPFTALLAGRNGLDRKYEAQAAEDEARRMAPQRAWAENYMQGLPDPQRFVAMTAPEAYAKNVAETFGEQKQEGPEIRQVGKQIVERQPDGTWKPVYEGATEAETARAFQGFIDDATGEQMLVMSDGTVRGTGRTAYVPPQIASVGGVPVSVDKRTNETTPLAPLEDAAGNAAAMASAKVQGGAQGQVAFDLPVIEQRAGTAMASINDLKRRDIGTRFGMQGKLYAIPGTDGADVQALVNQVTSQAFLNAFEQLKGGGAITEREGQAATQAITRLQNQNISIAEALKAMDELQAYYQKGIQVARERAVKAPVLPQRPVAGQALAPMQPPQPQKSWVTKQAERLQSLAPKPAAQIPEGVDPEDWKYMTDEQKALFQ
jgi:hypothetical protein